MARRILWFSTKAGILGAAIYGTNEIGIWGDSKQSTKLLEDVIKLLKPYIKQGAPHIKVQPESLPSMAEISSSTKSYWNKGVLNTSLFIADLPSRSVSWSNSAIRFVSEQLQQAEPTKEEN